MRSVAVYSGPYVRARSTSERRALRVALIVLGGFGLAIFFLAVAERIVFSGDVMPGVRVDGVDIDTESEAEARKQLSALAAEVEAEPLRATVSGRELVADPATLEVDVDELGTLEAARRAGRSGNPLEQTLGAVLRRLRADEIPLQVRYNEAALASFLDVWHRETANGIVEGALQFQGSQVIEVQPKPGTGIVRDEAERRLVRELRAAGDARVALPVGDVDPQVTSAEVARAGAQARELLTGTHEIVLDTTAVTITPEQLAAAMTTRIEGDRLELEIGADALRNALGSAIAPLEQAPVDATFAITNAGAVEVVASVNGRQVDLANVAQAILDGSRRIPASITEVVPARDTAWAQSLGIEEQVSSFTTRHNAGEARVKNIHRGADLINNTVVEPGATFSLNDALGPRTIERGFVVAPVFYGEFTEDVGGGVSQLATTVFNAVFWGGYTDIYHKPHSIYISRYPMGREATLNYPTVDLKFENNSKAGVLIRTSYSANAITVSFYGDKEGKVVREEGRKILGEEATETRYYDCPGPSGLDEAGICDGLGAGQSRLVEGGHDGIDVEFYRVIEQPGHEPVRERFHWRYRMFPNQYLVGTTPATTVPPTTSPTPTPTASPTPSPTVAPPPTSPPTAPPATPPPSP